MDPTITRGTFLTMLPLIVGGVTMTAQAQFSPKSRDELLRMATQASTGIRVLPGQWRPHYPYEHIAWVRPPWWSDGYIWLDFPEAIFANNVPLFMSHINPRVPSMYPELPKVEWVENDRGIQYERMLPNGVRFRGSITTESRTKVALYIFLHNGLNEPLRNIFLQTCAYLGGIKEFSDRTMDNKYVYVEPKGMVPFSKGEAFASTSGKYALGWSRGNGKADWPVIAARSNSEEERFVAMTWHDATFRLTGNPDHPCLHADPKLPDLEPGGAAKINGHLYFFEGTLDDLSDYLRQEFGG